MDFIHYFRKSSDQLNATFYEIYISLFTVSHLYSFLAKVHHVLKGSIAVKFEQIIIMVMQLM